MLDHSRYYQGPTKLLLRGRASGTSRTWPSARRARRPTSRRPGSLQPLTLKPCCCAAGQAAPAEPGQARGARGGRQAGAAGAQQARVAAQGGQDRAARLPRDQAVRRRDRPALAAIPGASAFCLQPSCLLFPVLADCWTESRHGQAPRGPKMTCACCCRAPGPLAEGIATLVSESCGQRSAYKGLGLWILLCALTSTALVRFWL